MESWSVQPVLIVGHQVHAKPICGYVALKTSHVISSPKFLTTYSSPAA